jgi:y4mF family transcriptional regulator
VQCAEEALIIQTSVDALRLSVVKARKAQNLRQQDLADLANVSCRFLSDLENGKATVELNKVLQVLHTLGLDLQVVGKTPRGKTS